MRNKVAHLPVAFVRGLQSNEVSQVGLGLTKKVVKLHPKGQFHTIEGSHLFPMEKPFETAQLILSCIRHWEDKASMN